MLPWTQTPTSRARSHGLAHAIKATTDDQHQSQEDHSQIELSQARTSTFVLRQMRRVSWGFQGRAFGFHRSNLGQDTSFCPPISSSCKAGTQGFGKRESSVYAAEMSDWQVLSFGWICGSSAESFLLRERTESPGWLLKGT